jgi:hypothetical protein
MKKGWPRTWSTALCRALLHVHFHLFFIFHYTQLYYMYIITSFLCFTTHSCTSCTLSPLFLYLTTHSCTSCTFSPLFYASLDRAVRHVHCHLFFMFHYTPLCSEIWKRGDNVHEVQLCVVKQKKGGDNVQEVQLWVEKHKKEVTMYMTYSSD